MGSKLRRSKTGIIFAGGEVLNYSVIKNVIGPDDLIVCADSGYYHCEKIGIVPDLIVGDFDSIKSNIPESIPKVTLPEGKNYTDTTFAVEGIIQQGCKSIKMIGMLGGRLDHTLANLQSLVYCTKQNITCYITDGISQVFCIHTEGHSPKKITFPTIENHYFSLISFSEQCVGVTIENAKFLLDDYTLTYDLARAVSNEFIDKDVTVTLKKGTMLIIFSPIK